MRSDWQWWGSLGCLAVLSVAGGGCGREGERVGTVVEVEAEEIRAAVAAGAVHQLEAWSRAEVSIPDKLDRAEALTAALTSGDEATMRKVLALYPGAEGLEGILAQAVREGKTGPVRALLAEGLSPAAKVEGVSLLAWALAARSAESVRALVEAGADVNEPLATPVPEALVGAMDDSLLAYYLRRERNVTPLMVACATGQLEVVRVLLAAGAARNAKTSKHRTTAIWLAGKNQHVEVVQLLLGKDPAPEAQTRRIEISLSRQRATLFENGEVKVDSPISSGKKGFATPKGRFVVTNKYRDWKSTIYDQAPMPFFMRLSCSDFGLHAGRLPGYPASHGCIRLPRDKAIAFFEQTEIGTLVEVMD